ncbi:MAG: NifX-associated nitrogen fixation protein [Hyphomicrobiaceae bacterium]|nr:NifX-associated nitrogen fixation protein [Hyphomicrobiaceae bacterium]
MPAPAPAPLAAERSLSEASPFIATLIRLIRAQDTYGVWEGRPDAALIAPFIVTKEERRAMPLMADPDPDTIQRLELFYNAVALSIERVTGLVASPMMKIHHEGFGRVLLTMGKLVVLSRHLRDVHRFGFDSVEKLATEGEKLVVAAVETINAYPEVAKA